MRRACWIVLGLIGAGVVLLSVLLASELLLLPHALETPARLLYRIVFFLVLPARLIVAPVLPNVDHTWPVAHFVAAAFLTPPLYGATWLIGRAAWRGFRRLQQTPSHTAPRPYRPISRRRFLAYSTLGGTGLVSAGLGGYVSLVAPQQLRVSRYTIPIRDLPPALDGLRIVHVSDTHYGPYNGMPYLERAADMANALDGDLLAFTGDYTHQRPITIRPGIELLARFRARLGAAAVLGNHDHWEGTEACKAVFHDIGIPLVDNTRLFLTPDGIQPEPVPGKSICLAGAGDLWADEVRMDEALQDVPRGMPRLVLSHNPDVAEEMDGEHRVDLMLSGHTHGGQVSFPRVGARVVPSRYGQKYKAGLCHGPHCPVVVSRGVGVTILPVRFRVPPDIGLITLKRA